MRATVFCGYKEEYLECLYKWFNLKKLCPTFKRFRNQIGGSRCTIRHWEVSVFYSHKVKWINLFANGHFQHEKKILHFVKQLRCLDMNNYFGFPSTEQFEKYTILKPCFIYIACWNFNYLPPCRCTFNLPKYTIFFTTSHYIVTIMGCQSM